MPQDIISNAMNCIMNAKRARKEEVIVAGSKFLLEVLKIMKENDYIKNFETKENSVMIEIGSINECKSIKPKHYVKKNGFEKYVRRFLPSRDFGIIIVSTSNGLMTHKDAIKQATGGSLIAYVF